MKQGGWYIGGNLWGLGRENGRNDEDMLYTWLECSKNKVLIIKWGKCLKEKMVANCIELLQLHKRYSSHVCANGL